MILITGSAGYIGAVLCSYLRDRGYKVKGVDTGYYRDGYFCGVENDSYLRKDIRDYNDELFEDVDAVVYLSELSNDPLGQLDPPITYAINHSSCVNFMQACIEHGIKRFVYASSCSVYGDACQGMGASAVTEEIPPSPISMYARCKTLNERALLDFASAGALCPVILRNGTVYGPSPYMRFDLCVQTMCGVAWTTSKVVVENEGVAWRPLVHVEDVCQAIHLGLDVDYETVKSCGHVFNVGATSQNYQIIRLAQMIAAYRPGISIVRHGYLLDKRSYKVDFSMIASLGFTPQHTVESGIVELFDLFGSIGMTSHMYNQRAYRRVDQIKYLIETGQLSQDFRWVQP